MSAAIFVLAAVLFGGAVVLYNSALIRVRQALPQSLCSPLLMVVALDAFIWTDWVPVIARREYLISWVVASASAGSSAAFLYLQGSSVGFLMLTAVLVLGMTFVLVNWIRRRDCL